MSKIIQLTNNAIGTVTAGSTTPQVVPLGTVTRRYGGGCCQNLPTYEVTTTGNNTLVINETGIYRVTYIANVSVGAAASVTLNLVQNGTVLYSATVTETAAGTLPVTIVYDLRVANNYGAVVNVPATIQITSTGAALTGGTSNFIVEKIA